MNTLVAYESSSEEDEVAVKEPEANRVTATHIIPPTNQLKSLPNTRADEEPIVGASMPPNTAQSYEDYYEDDDNTINLPTSERDTIRYLTQVTHPMTEMPPSPPGSPDPSAAARFKHFLNLKAKGVHFNDDLARKNAFKNPSLLQTLIDRAGLSHSSLHRTALPSNVFDPDGFPPESYKEALLKDQQNIRAKEEIEKKSLSAAGKRTMQFTSGGISAGSSAASSPGVLHKRSKQ